jgi:hypothetical protein
MFVPVYDDNLLRSIKKPYVTWLLIVANFLIFFAEMTNIPEGVVASFAIVPNELFKVGILGGPAMGPNDALAVPEGYTLLT